MDFYIIPEKHFGSEAPSFGPGLTQGEGDVLDGLLAKLPLLKSVFDAEMRELKALIQELGPDFDQSPIFKDRAEESPSGRGALHYQGFLSVLNGIYRDPGNAYHQTLTQFMEQHRFLMTEMLAKALLDKEIHEASGGKTLSDAANALKALLGEAKEGGALFRIVNQLLSLIESGKIALFGDLKAWIRAELLQNLPYIRHPDLSSSEIRSLLASMGMEEETPPPMTLLERLHEKASELLKDLSVSQALKEWISFVLLPKLEEGAHHSGFLERPSKDPSASLSKGENLHPSEAREQASFLILHSLQGPEIHEFLDALLHPGEFPVIVPYTAPMQPPARKARWRLKKRRSYSEGEWDSNDERGPDRERSD